MMVFSLILAALLMASVIALVWCYGLLVDANREVSKALKIVAEAKAEMEKAAADAQYWQQRYRVARGMLVKEVKTHSSKVSARSLQ